jgi:hypothetical protein
MSRGAYQALVLLLTLMSACTVVVEERPVPSPIRACTLEHAPVCARRGNQQRTFSNACMARSSGFQVMHRGQCRTAVRPIACTREFAPVCARRGGEQRTFTNACNAQASGFQIWHRGQCRASVRPNPGRPAACTREFQPVCAVRGNAVRTFDNACLARANGFRIRHAGRCR